ARRFAFRLARISGLSTDRVRPLGMWTRQCDPSPLISPCQCLSSIRCRPLGVKTSRSTSLTELSGARNSTFVHAKYGSASGSSTLICRRPARSCAHALALISFHRGESSLIPIASLNSQRHHLHPAQAQVTDSRNPRARLF